MTLVVSELLPGMKVAEDFRVDGVILLVKGSIINNSVLEKLQNNYFFNKIVIYHDYRINKNNAVQAGSIQKTVKEIEDKFNKFKFEIEEIFGSISKDKVSDIEGVREFGKKIQGELTSGHAVIKNIVLYGSGKDPIYKHSVNVAALSALLGRWIGLKEAQINLLTYSAILHDYGKSKIETKILHKVGQLTTKEYQEIKNHVVIGYNFVKELPFIDESVSYGVLMHHERGDGSGYPLGLTEKSIHQFAKIIAIADVFDAVNSDRIYKTRKLPLEALDIIKKESLGKLDNKYCNIFLEHIINFYLGENILLSNDEMCKIIKIDINDITKPLLMGDKGFIDLKKEKELYIKKLL